MLAIPSKIGNGVKSGAYITYFFRGSFLREITLTLIFPSLKFCYYDNPFYEVRTCALFKTFFFKKDFSFVLNVDKL